MGCRYLDFNGKVFGEASTALGIEKFHGTKRINSLGVFPLQYHQSEKDTKAYLEKCGRKFLSLMNVHHCQYQGMAFYMKRKRPVKVFVNSKIMVYAGYFREANPNYTRPSINDDHTDMYISWPPGSGKTFTAEALCEYLQLPLYAVCLSSSTTMSSSNFAGLRWRARDKGRRARRATLSHLRARFEMEGAPALG
jgi:hypothetical protein